MQIAAATPKEGVLLSPVDTGLAWSVYLRCFCHHCWQIISRGRHNSYADVHGMHMQSQHQAVILICFNAWE